MLKVSIITPTHNTKYLKELYDSIKDQGFYEWVVVLNNGAVMPQINDSRIKTYTYESSKVGELKNFGFMRAKGEILIEMDHDDLLTDDCIEEVRKAFEEDKDASMVYSNFAQVNADWTPNLWSTYYGWEFRDFEYKGHKIKEAVSPKPYVSNLGRIWFAPNHVRAWRADFYKKIGGHDVSMRISDDHDLVARSYLNGKIVHIDKCLYIYRVHGDNTWLQCMQEIEDTMWDNYLKYIFPMINKWADNEKLLKVDLGGGIDTMKGYKSVDLRNADYICDLNDKWCFKDNSVGVFRANDLVEHLKDPIHTMNEAYRCLKHGGFFMINVPSTKGEGAFCDPTHVSFWNKRSFRYYTEQGMRRYIEPACKCRFQVMKLSEGKMYEGVDYVFAHLIAIKDGPRFHGELLI